MSAHAADSSAGHHLNAFDGIRGIAITMVILFHSEKVHCGWAGVQVFFVLSGFLITRILLRDSDLAAGLYFKRFYWRRSLRIFPLYYGFLLVLAIVCLTVDPVWFSGLPAKHQLPVVFHRDWPYLLTYTLNFRRILPDFGSNPYYGRFWTLAVEEQFYLVWPLLVYCVPRKYFSRLVVAILAAGPVARALTAYFLTPVLHDSSLIGAAVYYLTPGQMDSFALGAAVVLFGNRLRNHAVAIFFGCTALLLLGGQIEALITTGEPAFNSGLGYDVNMLQAWQHVWGYTLINVWAGGLILAASSRNWVSRVLSFQPLTYLGRISYGMYVYHQIILFAGVLKYGKLINTRHGFLIYFLCVVIVSDLSFRLYESRFLALKNTRFSRPRTKAVGTQTIAV